MGWNRLLYGEQKQRLSAKEKAAQEAKRKTLLIGGAVGVGVLVLSIVLVVIIARGSRTVIPEEPAKERLRKLLALYQVYGDKNKKGPPNEQALRAFGQKLSAKERDEYLIGDDLDDIFISPRDNQKYVIVYNLKPDPGGETRAVAWEADGKGGKRFVALSNGYVEEYDDETLKEYKK